MEKLENKEDNTNWMLALLGLAAIAAIWAVRKTFQVNTLKKENQELKAEVVTLKANYLELLQEFIKKTNELPTEIKQQLQDLQNHYSGIDPDVEAELARIIQLIETNHATIAIEKLVKIVEDLLKEKYVQEKKAPSKEKCPYLYKLLEEALSLKWITQREFSFANLLRGPRNKEAHELNVNYPKNEIVIYLLAGIEILHTLKGIRKAQS